MWLWNFIMFTTRAIVGACDSARRAFAIGLSLSFESVRECFGEWSARKVNGGARKFPRCELMQSVANVSDRNTDIAGAAQRQIPGLRGVLPSKFAA
jgi:hypothetical protein